MSDDLLGQQQDDLARLRYELAKTIEGAPDFQDCKTGMEIYHLLLELGQEVLLRAELMRNLQRLRSDFNAEPWIDRFVQAIRNKDQTSYDRLYQKALIAAIFPNPNQ